MYVCMYVCTHTEPLCIYVRRSTYVHYVNVYFWCTYVNWSKTCLCDIRTYKNKWGEGTTYIRSYIHMDVCMYICTYMSYMYSTCMCSIVEHCLLQEACQPPDSSLWSLPLHWTFSSPCSSCPSNCWPLNRGKEVGLSIDGDRNPPAIDSAVVGATGGTDTHTFS